jgi:hypothetical protein
MNPKTSRALPALALLSCLAWPAVVRADSIIYTLALNYDNDIAGIASGSVVDWQFAVPSILTSDTVIGSFLSASVGGAFSGCSISNASVPATTSIGILPGAVAEALTGFAAPCSTIPNDVGIVTGSVALFYTNIDSLGTFTAYSRGVGNVLGTLTIADDVTLQGGTTFAPVALTQSLIGGVNGLIGGLGTEDYYGFYWFGGAFSASATIGGTPNAGASYLFSEGAPGSCDSGGTATLNGGDSFTGTIADSNLAAGFYCIGIDANNSNDPPFAITFNTPVSGVPEPSTFALFSTALALIGARRLASRL